MSGASTPEGFEVEIMPGPVAHHPDAVRFLAERVRNDLAQTLFTKHGHVPLCAYVFTPWGGALRVTNWLAPTVGPDTTSRFAARLEQWVNASRAYAVLVMFEGWIVVPTDGAKPPKGVSYETIPGRKEGVYCTLSIRGQRDESWMAMIQRSPDRLEPFKASREGDPSARLSGRFAGWFDDTV